MLLPSRVLLVEMSHNRYLLVGVIMFYSVSETHSLAGGQIPDSKFPSEEFTLVLRYASKPYVQYLPVLTSPSLQLLISLGGEARLS